MAQKCSTFPTLTTNVLSTAQSQSTTVSVSTSTAPGSVVSSVVRTCTVNASPGVTTTCIPTATTIFSTYPGSTVVVTVPVTVAVDYTVTNQVTLFGSSCTSTPIDTSISTPTTYSTTTSTSYPTSTETSWSISTPPPSIVVLSSLVTSDGSTFTSAITSTSTVAPTSVLVTQTVAADHTSGQKKSNIGPIIGGVLGGLVALLLIGFIALRLIKRNTLDDIFNTDHHNKTTRDPEPKPYTYGPVSQQATYPTAMSPPPPPNQGFNDIGSQPSQPSLHHHRNSSLVPLIGAVGASAAVAGTVASSSQASSSASQSVGPATQAPQGQAQGYPPSSYPPALQNWGANQGVGQPYGAANTQGGYNAPGFASGSGQATGLPPSSLGHNPNNMSTGSVPSTYSTSSWGAGNNGPYSPPIVPIIAGSVRNSQQMQHYEDPFNRTGSPVSIHEQRILQVTNAEPRGSVYDPRAYHPEASSSSARPSSVAGSSQAASSSRVTDGKGRMLHVVGEKAPLVHLDGGIYEQQQPAPAPPAYAE